MIDFLSGKRVIGGGDFNTNVFNFKNRYRDWSIVFDSCTTGTTNSNIYDFIFFSRQHYKEVSSYVFDSEELRSALRMDHKLKICILHMIDPLEDENRRLMDELKHAKDETQNLLEEISTLKSQATEVPSEKTDYEDKGVEDITKRLEISRIDVKEEERNNIEEVSKETDTPEEAHNKESQKTEK